MSQYRLKDKEMFNLIVNSMDRVNFKKNRVSIQFNIRIEHRLNPKFSDRSKKTFNYRKNRL